MLTIRVEFNNDTECFLDGVVKYDLTKNFLKVKFDNGWDDVHDKIIYNLKRREK